MFPHPVTGQPNASDYFRYVYDPAGNVAQVELRDHTVIGYTYDGLNRLILKNLPGNELDVTYGYDLLNRMTSASTSARVLTFGYDALGRNTSQTGAFGTASYQYDAAGRRTRMTYPGTAIPLEIGYTYNMTSDVTAISEDPDGDNLVLALYQYDNLGRRTRIIRGNGADTDYSYDPVWRLAQLTQSLASTEGDLTLEFGHNPAGQISSVTRSNDSYAWTDHYGLSRTYAADGLNRYSQIGSVVPTYDARGNLLSADSPTYGYTSENRLSTVSGFTAATYDPLGRMNVITSGSNYTKFDYDSNSLIAEYSFSNALLRRYVHGPGVDEPLVWYEYDGSGAATTRWFHADERGSIIAVSNNLGESVGTFAYGEYGMSQGGSFLRFRYTGQVWLTELNMYYYRARMYSPSLGRFMQTDPIGYAAGMNLYAYVRNDPVNLADPTGLEEDIVVEGHRLNFCGNGGVQVGGICVSDRNIHSLAFNPNGSFSFTTTGIPVIDSGVNCTADGQRVTCGSEDTQVCEISGPVIFAGGSADLFLGQGGGRSAGLYVDTGTGELGTFGGADQGYGLGMSFSGQLGIATSIDAFRGSSSTLSVGYLASGFVYSHAPGNFFDGQSLAFTWGGNALPLPPWFASFSYSQSQTTATNFSGTAPECAR